MGLDATIFKQKDGVKTTLVTWRSERKINDWMLQAKPVIKAEVGVVIVELTAEMVEKLEDKLYSYSKFYSPFLTENSFPLVAEIKTAIADGYKVIYDATW